MGTPAGCARKAGSTPTSNRVPRGTGNDSVPQVPSSGATRHRRQESPLTLVYCPPRRRRCQVETVRKLSQERQDLDRTIATSVQFCLTPGDRGDRVTKTEDTTTRFGDDTMSAIIIFCGECGTKIVTDLKHAGKAAICPECEGKVPIPHKAKDRPQIRLFCPGCKNRVSADLARAGHTMRCPKCDEEISLPKIKMGSQGKEKRAEWMPEGIKKKTGKKPSKKGDTRPLDVVALKGDEDEEEDEDEILSLLQRMSQSQKRSDTEPLDVVEVVDDRDKGARRMEVPKVRDDDLQRAETQSMEPFAGPKRAGGKDAPERGKGETFRFTCPECGFRILVNASLIGKKGRCPDCKEVVLIRRHSS